MKRIVIIGANEFQDPLILKAKELGFETHVFAWKNGDIGEETADFFYPISIVEKEEILKECKKIKPNAIVSIGSDLATPTVTYIANKLKLNSNKYENVLKSTNKYEMRKALKEAGLNVPVFEKVSDISEIKDFNFPMIVKPTDRSGSRGVTLVTNKAELNKAIKKAIELSFEKKAIVEDVIKGNKEYSCETLSFNGKHTILAVTKKYTTGFPNCIETGHVEPADLSEEILFKLKKVIPRALDALDISNSPAHTEFIIDDEENINIVEIGARMGGDCIGSHLVMLSTGIDFLKQTIDVALGKEPDFKKSNKYNYAFIKFIFNQKDLDKINYVNNKYPNIIIEKNINDNFNHKVTDSSTRFGYCIYATDEKSIYEEIINEVKLYE